MFQLKRPFDYIALHHHDAFHMAPDTSSACRIEMLGLGTREYAVCINCSMKVQIELLMFLELHYISSCNTYSDLIGQLEVHYFSGGPTWTSAGLLQ